MAKTDSKSKILIAEDEKPLARALEMKLTRSGYEVTLAFNGDEALKALEKGKFALLLLDLMMPKVDGFGVLEQMRKKGNKTPAIVLTNLSQKEDEKRAKDLGAKDFFVKSNTPIADIVKMVEKIIA